ncbi:chalcone isomerase family protein [Endozoicomonas gorgoniicola]|uniref:Chalcone isomerase family protein n=1 Tax=Endozoicomonas gorgoniicola TaxID=1234144 RepID=A0ABT3MXS8_9GAMM|nr:chalcone isomerase family protein [Endozoicomonas gorgoniicola]MCW7553888.1 chalcone isomerase family protein [Endozoicomonas gorgoniicola]
MRLIVPICLMLISLLSQASTLNWNDWQTVGQGKLTWGFWTIYNSELRTPTGQYSPGQEPLALVITYQRNIDREDLLEATDEQWQHLGVPKARRAVWLAQLETIWPDVRKGDQLTFVFSHDEGVFFQADKPLGVPMKADFSRAFIDIWLSPETAYPGLRLHLLGKH